MKWTALEGIQDSTCFLSEVTFGKPENFPSNGDSDPGSLIHILIVKSCTAYVSVAIMYPLLCPCWVLAIWEGADFTFTFHFHALEKEMATHSSILAWRIPGMAEPGGLPSMGSHRVRHHWRDLAAAAESKTAKKREEMSKWGKCNIVKSSKRTTKSLSTGNSWDFHEDL